MSTTRTLQHPRFQLAPNPAASYSSVDVPIPTTRRPPQQSTNLRRNKTLTRPECGVANTPLITPPTILPAPNAAPSRSPSSDENSKWDPWSIFCHFITFWAPSVLLSSIGGMREKPTRQAWREKIGLCFIALVLGGIVGFLTMGLDRALCPSNDNTNPDRFTALGTSPGLVGIQGFNYNVSHSKSPDGFDFIATAKILSGQDITQNFIRSTANYPKCNGLRFQAAVDPPCFNSTCRIPLSLNSTTLKSFNLVNTNKLVGYDWDLLPRLTNYFVIDGAVLNFDAYMKAHPAAIKNDTIDKAIRAMAGSKDGKDATRLFYNRQELKQAVPCLTQRYYAGNIDKITPGCAVSQLILYAGLIVILGLVLVRFVMACIFNWFISARLVQTPKNLGRAVVSPAVMPAGANVQINSKNGTAPWANGQKKPVNQKLQKTQTPSSSRGASPVISMAQIGAELFTVCLVTCYSEGEDSVRSTLDSISRTTYSDSRKLLFVVCDGMVTGHGEKRSTPDICVNLLETDQRFGEPQAMSYTAVGLGAKAENRALVYAGHYTSAGRRTPTVIIVKCGTEAEANDKKPGNRGKRDSQLVLMNFFSRVTYNDRMTPLDFDLFRKIQILMGVTPDFFEACLMVDADTKVYPDSITQLVNSLHHDHLIMGVCGETRIANKRQSWVTAIQVYEYFISHHLAKAFESVFGGVTCLPGCFSMYRLKGRKITDDDWVPLLVSPDIVGEYSQSEVVTLHEKNLLLLGEDRFLTTILLRKFPNRKMMFLPQARCRTVAPDTFSVLLSQRRRWINSTIHNLMELVRVRNLCGTFCFSMQFIVFMDLLGTATLPVAIALTYSLIVSMILSPPNTFEKAIPLILLLAVIGLPAVLILITTRKVVYIFWMLIYLVALPVWNFVLPIYAYWHFDDFSWGETRKVAGESKGTAHDIGKRTVNGSGVPLRRWEDWERSRLRKLRREKKERTINAYAHSQDELLAPRPFDRYSTSDGSDTLSVASSDEDIWGANIGGYNEDNPAFPPPPQTLMADPSFLASASTLGDDDLQAILEGGFDDPPQSASPLRGNRPPPLPSIPASERYQVYDQSPQMQNYGTQPGSLPPREKLISPTSPFRPPDAASSAVAWQGHAKKRSLTGRTTGSAGYGPLGPLGD